MADLLLAQNEFGAIISTSVDVSCDPAGDEVVCELVQTDAFTDAAGLAPTVRRQTFRLVDDLVVEFGASDGGLTPEEQQAWLEQFAGFERWVADTRSDLYASVFAGPCCTGTPEGLRFTSEAMERYRTLLPEWVATR